MLQILLIGIYFLIVTPLALFGRKNRRSEVYCFSRPERRPGWREVDISSSNPETYRIGRPVSIRRELRGLAREKGDRGLAALFLILSLLMVLADDSNREDVRHDIYVMF